jgi:hypothetical protein
MIFGYLLLQITLSEMKNPVDISRTIEAMCSIDRLKSQPKADLLHSFGLFLNAL